MPRNAANAKIVLLRPLRLGYVALTDSAPLIAARELGLFQKHGLRVGLSREIGWATIRDKIAHGELDVAHAPAPMLWASHLGLDCATTGVCTGLVLNLHGNAITLSTRLRRLGVVDAATLRLAAQRLRGESQLTFGVVFPFSMHQLMLFNWLRAARIEPGRDVRIAIVPPAQMFRNLAAGTLDGYCAGEPWNSLAVQQQEGWCPAWSSSISPGHVEKVLMVRTDFATNNKPEHISLIRALAEAAAWCDAPENRPALVQMLAARSGIDLPAKVIAPALLGRFACGYGRIECVPDFHVFSRGEANTPTLARAVCLQAELVAAGLVPRALADSNLPRRLFREDLYREAINRSDSHAPTVTKHPGGALASA